MSFDIGAIHGSIKLDTSQFVQAKNIVTKGQGSMTKGASGLSGAFKGMWKQMAVGMGVTHLVTSGIRAIKTQITDTIQKGREFEREWANTTTMLTISTREMDKLKRELMNLSPTLGDTTELAKGMYQVLSASIEPAKAIEFLGVAAKAAKAGLTDVYTSVDALTTVINAYGMQAEEATKVSDIMFQTVKRGKLTYGELAGALGTVVPVAATVGIRFEEVAAALASLTRQGINVQTATMQLRQVFMAVLKPGKEAKDLAKGLGIEFNITAMKAMGLGKWLEHVKIKTGGSAQAYSVLFKNVRAMTPIMALAGRAAKGFADDIELMGIASGSTEEAFQKQMKTSDFWIKTLENSINKFKISFYTGFVDPLKTGISTSKDLEDRTKELTATFEDLGKVVGIGVMGFFGEWINKYKETKGLLTVFTSLIEGSTLAIKNGQIPTIKNAVKAWGEHQNVLNKNIEAAKKAQDPYFGLAGAITKNVEAIREHIGWILEDSKTSEEASKRIDEYRDSLKETSEEIKVVTELTDTEITATKGIIVQTTWWQGELITLNKILENTQEELKDMYETAVPAFRNMSGVVEQATDEMGSDFFVASEAIKESTKDAEQVVEKTWDELHPFWSNLCADLGGSFGNFAESILTTGSNMSDALQGLWGDIKSSFTRMIGDMIAEWMTKFIRKILSSTSDELVPGITSALNKITGSASSAGTSAGTSLTASFASALGVEAVVFTAFIAAVSFLDKLFPKHVKTMAELAAIEAKKAFDKAAKEYALPGEWGKEGISTGDEEEETGYEEPEPGFQTGGLVPKTGLAMVHQGEFIIPKISVPSFPSMSFPGQTNFQPSPTLASTKTNTVTVHINGPLVSTSGLSRSDLERAGEELYSIVKRQAQRAGGQI